MEQRKCEKCLDIKELSEYPKAYHKDIDKTYYSKFCKCCFNKNKRQLYDKEKSKEYRRKFYHKDVNKSRKAATDYYRKNTEGIKKRRKELYIINKKRIAERNKGYREKRKQNGIKSPYKPQTEQKKAYMKLWRENNRDKIRKQANNYTKNRMRRDPLFKLTIHLRNRMNEYFDKTKFKKSNTTTEMLGIDYENLKIYLEKQFKKGMTWENHGIGGWHIDHIIPLSSAKSKEEMVELFHYRNLQPMWEAENIIKGNKIPKIQLKLTI